jgi:hypothetical protein
LRTADRYRWILIPGKIEEFEAMRRKSPEIGIPVVGGEASSELGGVRGVLVFTGTMICAILAHSTRVRLGIFLPVVMTASMLWSAW